jgi:predicted dehydrogenase
MTDWGAHHIDIAQWAINGLPVSIDGRGKPTPIQGGYNVHERFGATIRYDNDVVLEIHDEGRVGILFEGDEGRMFVNRGSISGKPVEDLESTPLPREAFALYDQDNLARPERVGKLDAIVNHMGNFFDCIESRKTPISDLESQHRSVTTCHLANISLRLARPIKWDPEAETILGDSEAAAMLSRPQREGFEVA